MKCRNDCATGADLNAFLLNDQQLHAAPTSSRKLRGSNARVDLTSLTVFNFRLGETVETPESTTPNIHLNFATQLRPKRVLSCPRFPIPHVCPYTGPRPTFEGDSEDDAAGDGPALRLFPTIVDTRMPPPKATATIVPVYFRK